MQNLLESVGNLPETAIKSLASQTLEAIEDLHSKLNTPHGGISPSQLLLDKNGNVKVRINRSPSNLTSFLLDFYTEHTLLTVEALQTPLSRIHSIN